MIRLIMSVAAVGGISHAQACAYGRAPRLNQTFRDGRHIPTKAVMPNVVASASDDRAD